MAAEDERCGVERRVLRADAARNRAAILEAASAVLAEQGSAVDVREIARLSGVGMGTLYRHFPTKDDLLETVLHEEFLAWARSARRTAVACGDPWVALTGFFEEALAQRAHHRAMMQCYADRWSVPTAECSLLLRPVIEELLARAQAAGVVRAGVTGEDLSLLLASLGQAVRLTDGGCRPQLWQRLVRISLDGLRAEHGEPLPCSADCSAVPSDCSAGPGVPVEGCSDAARADSSPSRAPASRAQGSKAPVSEAQA